VSYKETMREIEIIVREHDKEREIVEDIQDRKIWE